MRKIALLVALMLLAPAALATPLNVYMPRNFEYESFYVYDGSSGSLLQSGSVNGAVVTINYTGSPVVLKVTGSNVTAVVAVPGNLNTDTYTPDFAQLVFTVKFVGNSIYRPSSVMVTVSPGGLANVTAQSSYTVLVSVPSRIWVPEKLYYPALYGFTLTGITVNDSSATNPFNVTSSNVYEVEVAYEPTGIAALDPLVIVALAVAVFIVAVVLAARRSSPAVVAAYKSGYLE